MKPLPKFVRYVARALTGALFLLSGIGKIVDVQAFGNLIVSYGFPWISIVAPVIVVLEFALGLMLVLDLLPRISVPVSIGLLIVFTVAFVYGNVFHGIEDCGCFGAIDIMKMPAWATYLRNGLLLALLIIGREGIGEDAAPDKTMSIIWAFCMALVLFFTGYTFEPSQFYKELSPRRHPLLNLDVRETPIADFVTTSADSTYTLYVFSYSCISCINGLSALREYQDPAICDRVIGLAVNEDKNNEIHDYFSLPFQIVNVGDALGRFTHTVPTMLYVRDNRIAYVVEGGIPGSWWFRKGYLENL